MPARVQEAMQMQVEAERKKRAAILESEGIREADINVAEGKRQARILASEAERQEQINKATGEAAAILSIAEARAGGLKVVAQALEEQSGPNAASLSVAEQYVQAFNKLAQTNNTLILPANAGDVSSLVAQVIINLICTIFPHFFFTLKALSVYSKVTQSNTQKIHHKKSLPKPLPKCDPLAELFSDEEERKKHKDKQSIQQQIKEK